MEKINKKNLKVILEFIVNVLESEKGYLIELDGEMGDGDLGLTMTKGFKSLYDEIDNIESQDMGAVLMKLGMTMNSNVPSTMGTLISICILRSGKEAKGKNEIGLEDIVKMGKAAVKGVIEKGKTQVGNKTMLDALYPAVMSLEDSAAREYSLSEAFKEGYKAACVGVEETKKLKSVHGRAAYYGEKSIGRPDAGAVAVMLIFKGISESFK